MNSDRRPEVRPDLLTVNVDDELIVFDPVVGRVHRLDPVAAALFGVFDGAATLAEIAQDLAVLFEDAGSAGVDLNDFVDRLAAEGLLSTDRESS